MSELDVPGFNYDRHGSDDRVNYKTNRQNLTDWRSFVGSANTRPRSSLGPDCLTAWAGFV